MRERIDLPVAADEIFRRYERGEMLVDIAKSLEMSERTLYRRLLEHPDKWKAAQTAVALQRYEVAKERHQKSVQELEALKRQLDEEGINDAAARNWRLAHVVAIERACERLLNRAEWELERVADRLYGQQKQQVNAVPVQINIGIAKDQSVTIDAEQ